MRQSTKIHAHLKASRLLPCRAAVVVCGNGQSFACWYTAYLRLRPTLKMSALGDVVIRRIMSAEINIIVGNVSVHVPNEAI